MNALLTEPLLPANSPFGRSGTAPGYQIKNAKGELISTSGKTGTADGNRDKWFVGYTPYYIGAVWYGYDGRLKTINIPSNDSSNAIKIWHNVMTSIHAKLVPADFYEPPTLVKLDICMSSGKLATEGCSKAGKYVVKENFLPDVDINPTDYCTVHDKYIPVTAAPTSAVTSDVTSSASSSASTDSGASTASSIASSSALATPAAPTSKAVSSK
jgi:membrane carboxypeptidase/penicillin-binding protein